MTGIPILQTQFASLRLVVEVAFGVPPGSNGPWTDVTGDLRAGGVTITPGRADEAAETQPADLKFDVNDPAGRWTLGPQSPNQGLLPNIPIRVRVLLNGTSYLRYQGEITEITPGWDDTGEIAIASITGSGPLRRLGADDQPIASAMKHFVLGQSGLVAYWPCEDGSKSLTLASATGGSALTSSLGFVKSPASYQGFVASQAAPTLGAESWTGYGFGSSNTLSGGTVTFLIHVPAGTIADQTRLMTINVASAALSRIDILYATFASGSFLFNAYQGSTLVATGAWAGVVQGADSQDVMVGFTWSPFTIASSTLGGPDLLMDLNASGLEDLSFGVTQQSLASASISGITSIVVAPDAAASGVAIGHLYMQTGYNVNLGAPDAAIAFNGEAVTDRIARVATEQGEIVTITGTSTQTMGPQPVAPYLTVLRECETRDIGVLYDGAGQGLSYTARDSRENQAPALTLSAAGGDVVAFPPAFDDQNRINKFTASRTQGSSYTWTDPTSPLSVAAIGVHPASATINCQSDADLPDYAGHKVATGSVAGYRYPRLQFAIHSRPRLLAGWLTAAVSSRIDVTGVANVRINQDPRNYSLLLEGWTETIAQEHWDVAANTVSYDPWRVGILAADTGDTGEFLSRLDPDGSTLTVDAAAGANTLTVTTPSGPLWATGSGDDFPIALDVGGLQVSCTSISGSSSPQTFNVAPMAMRIPAGSTVTTWRNPLLGM